MLQTLLKIGMCTGWLLLFGTGDVRAGRPLVVDDARPVIEGGWEFEFGFAGAQLPKGAHEIDAPIMALTYGVLPRLDLSFNIQRVRSDARAQTALQGFQDLHIASKYNLFQETNLPAVSFALDVKVPTANRNKGLSTGRVDENFLLIATKHFIRDGELTLLGVDLNLGYSVINSPPGDKLKNRLFGGLALRYGLTDRLRLVGDIYGQSREAKGEKHEANFQMGIRFRPDLPVFFDAAVGRSLLPSGPRIQGTFGLTWATQLRF